MLSVVRVIVFLFIPAAGAVLLWYTQTLRLKKQYSIYRSIVSRFYRFVTSTLNA